MEHESPREITLLLQGWRDGDRKALDALLPFIYKELRRLAHFQLRKERPDHTLQSAALVNEAYLRLANRGSPVGEPHTFLRHRGPADAPDPCRLCPPPRRRETRREGCARYRSRTRSAASRGT